MKRYLLTTAIAAVPFAFASTAHADCNKVGGIANGETVTCDATSIETRELEDGSPNITVNVLDNATIDTSTGGDAIKLQDDDNAVNIGRGARVEGGDEAIVGGNGLTVTNFGTVIGADGGIIGENEASDDSTGVTVYNGTNAAGTDTEAAASITASDKAIEAGADLEVYNNGRIESSGDEAIQGGANTRVENDGTIKAVEKAIDANGDGFVLINRAGAVIESTVNEGVEADGDGSVIENRGTIKAFDDAVQVGENAVIDNYGLIENTQSFADVEPSVPGVEAQDAIDIDSGTVNNHAGGTIRSTTNAAIDFDPGATDSAINNWGDIEGTVAIGVDDADTAGQHVTNYGRLFGSSGTALALGLGDDSLHMMASGVMEGGADFGAGMDDLVFDAGFSFDSTAFFAEGALFDGGTDFDTLTFGNKTLTDIEKILGYAGYQRISFVGGGGLKISSWESIVFSDGSTYATSDLVINAVPLPAGVALLGSGLAGLGLVSLRRRKRSGS